MNTEVVIAYLGLLDSQREAAFSALEGLNDAQVWQRPAPKEWSVGEILDHNYLLIARSYPLVRAAWSLLRWYGERKRTCPYLTEIPDLYRDGKFPILTCTLRLGIYYDQLHYDDVFKLTAKLKL